VLGGERTLDLDGILSALAARDPGTARHSRDVRNLAERVAIRLGLTDEGVAEVAQVAALHDVGKLATPDGILFKPSPLNVLEQAIMREHAAEGAFIVAELPALSHLAEAVRATHERWDGCGYPDGLSGAEIPLASRIVFVCDAYDAMVSPRPYRPALRPELAVAEIRRCAGTQFCPASATALLGVLELEAETALAC
jgi:putative nucleotidyltransferase with HDIG domain